MTTTTKATGFNLFAAMATVDLSSTPPSGDQLTAVLDGETVIGTMSEDLVRIYRVALSVVSPIDALRAKAREMDAAHALSHEEAERTENYDGLNCHEHAEKLAAVEQEAELLMAQLENLKSIFWGMIRLGFPDAGVREGNKVVLCPTGEKDDSAPLELQSFLAAIEDMGGELIRM